MSESTPALVSSGLAGRLLAALASIGPAGTTIETSNRDLARQAGCCAGAVPSALRTLEANGAIAIREHPTSAHE
jgi:hypothetical protein